VIRFARESLLPCSTDLFSSVLFLARYFLLAGGCRWCALLPAARKNNSRTHSPAETSQAPRASAADIRLSVLRGVFALAPPRCSRFQEAMGLRAFYASPTAYGWCYLRLELRRHAEPFRRSVTTPAIASSTTAGFTAGVTKGHQPARANPPLDLLRLRSPEAVVQKPWCWCCCDAGATAR